MEKTSNAYRIVVSNPDGKLSLGRPRRRGEDNIKMSVGEIARLDGG
jgi:hypothetical protein